MKIYLVLNVTGDTNYRMVYVPICQVTAHKLQMEHAHYVCLATSLIAFQYVFHYQLVACLVTNQVY